MEMYLAALIDFSTLLSEVTSFQKLQGVSDAPWGMLLAG
jgi:hypothetical protein